MKFFKYLIFLFLSLLPSFTFAVTYKYDGKLYNSADAVCKAYLGTTQPYTCNIYETSQFTAYFRWTYTSLNQNGTFSVDIVKEQYTCPDAGTPFLKSFPTGNPIPTVQCVNHPDGTSCKYENKDAASKVNNMGSRQQVFLYSVGTQPVSNCTDQFAGSCNSNDPYGGCYTPPNDKCTRGSDGSIYCPDDAPPPKIETGCTGSATYCERPKGGCGSDYVSGSYNGKSVCVKKSGNTGNNNGTGNGNTPTPPGGSTATTNNSDGSKTTVTSDANGNPVSTTVTGADGSSSTTTINKDGTSTTTTKKPDGTSSTTNGTTTTVKNPDGSTTTTTVNNNNTTVINNNNNSTTTTTTNPNAGGGNHTTGGTTVVQQAPPVDMSGVISAINAVSEKISWLKDELSTSINDVSGKLDGTNEKLDQTNTKLDESNNNLKDIKEVLDEIKNKPDGSNPSSSPNGDGPDLSGIEGLLTDIKDGIKNVNDTLNTVFSDEGKAEIDKIGTEKNDSKLDSAKHDSQNKLNNLANKLTFSNSACINDLVINLGQFGDVTIKLSEYCELLALTKILLHLSVLMLALRMVDATIRGL